MNLLLTLKKFHTFFLVLLFSTVSMYLFAETLVSYESLLEVFIPFQANAPFLCSLKTSENQRLYDEFQGCRKRVSLRNSGTTYVGNKMPWQCHNFSVCTSNTSAKELQVLTKDFTSYKIRYKSLRQKK